VSIGKVRFPFVDLLRVGSLASGLQTYLRQRASWVYAPAAKNPKSEIPASDMDEVRNDYIDKALGELIPTLGVKDFFDDQELISLIHAKKIKECIKAIASQLGLPIEINISWVPKGYRPSTNTTANDGFKSTHIVKTGENNRGTAAITAQVSIPPSLPLYGSPSMVNFPINVRLSENCADNPATLIGVMAHELSHILLYSLWHKEKENEFYTDLTAMLLGFAEIMKTGRKVIKTTTTRTETTTTTEVMEVLYQAL
jgi:hypothetical protein